MADFPTFEKDANRPREAVTITPGTDDENTTPEQKLINQQWRDAEALGLGKTHPLSVNRDADEVTE